MSEDDIAAYYASRGVPYRARKRFHSSRSDIIAAPVQRVYGSKTVSNTGIGSTLGGGIAGVASGGNPLALAAGSAIGGFIEENRESIGSGLGEMF